MLSICSLWSTLAQSARELVIYVVLLKTKIMSCLYLEMAEMLRPCLLVVILWKQHIYGIIKCAPICQWGNWKWKSFAIRNVRWFILVLCVIQGARDPSWEIDHSGYGLSQWETPLQCNVVSHRLNPDLERTLNLRYDTSAITRETPSLLLFFPCCPFY